MNKKWWIGGGIFVLVSLGIGLFLWKMQSSNSSSSLTQILEQTESSGPSTKLTHWDDPAGFSLEYPEDLTLDKHDEDQENYAHLEFTHKDHPGKLVIWAKDPPVTKKGTKVATVEEWVQNEPLFVGANILDTTLSQEDAKKILTTSPAALVTGTFYDGLLFYIETTLEDNQYWSKVHEVIVSNFSFKSTAPSKTNTSGGPVELGGESVDEEEVIE